jgi:hypothetical protein
MVSLPESSEIHRQPQAELKIMLEFVHAEDVRFEKVIAHLRPD